MPAHLPHARDPPGRPEPVRPRRPVYRLRRVRRGLPGGRDQLGRRRMRRTVHPIEAKSYRILRSTVDTGRLPRHTRDVVERIVHTTADLAWLDDLVTDEAALA